MGTENPNRPNFPLRHASTPFSAPPSSIPFQASSIQPPPPPPYSPVPVDGSESSGFRPMSPGVPSSPSQRPPFSALYGPSATTSFQRYPTPQFSSTPQFPPSHTSFVGQPSFQSPPLSNVGPSQSMSTLQPSAPMNSFRQSAPPTVSSYSISRPTLQPGFPGYPSQQPTAVAQHPIGQSAPFSSQQGGYTPHPAAGPPIPQMHGLVEDFNSLSIGSVPGSYDTGVDAKLLPRPLEVEDDMHQSPLSEMFPMNCSSRYLRLTTSGIPTSQSLASRWYLSLGAVVCPLAEAPDGEEVPVINFATTGIIRCRRCRTYVNPYVTFTDNGRKWKCNMCQLHNDVPGDYFAHLDARGRRVDFDQRPELSKGSVEFIAPAEYMVRPPMPPLYFFLIDVSISAVKSGMLQVIANTIKSCLDRLPGYPRTQIGFITYDTTIHFYNMKSSLTQPQMMVVSDLEDTFVPLPDDLLVNLSESRAVVDAFLDCLPSMFEENVNVESAFGPALKAAFMIMNQLGGKLLIFQNMLPSLGIGRLMLRGDDPRLYGTDKEHTLRIPEDPFYKQMAADFTKYQIAVNVYTFSDKYTDLATLGTLAKYTGGQVYHYPSFHASIHKDKLSYELARDLTRETAWESVMRIRCGKGIRFTTYHGNFMLRSTDLVALPAVDCDKAYAMQLSLEETLLTTQTVYFQVALLYTSSSGERRIRVHTAAAPVVAELGEMYRLADTGAIVSLFSRLAIEKTLSSKLEEARSSVHLRIVKALREYRNLYAVQHRLGGRMIYPESLKLLPLYGLALSKSTPLRGGYSDVQLDERCAAAFTMMALPVKKLLKLLYPTLTRIDEYLLKTSASVEDYRNMLRRLPLTIASLEDSGLYIYDDGFQFVIWFGRMLSPDIIKALLGNDFAADLSKVCIREQDNEISRKLTGLLSKYRRSDPSYYQISHLVRQGEQPREGFYLLKHLVEDQMGGSNGYMDWIIQLHRQVQHSA
ncbi:unnamed protein product [Cuscuta epithymum]|uniref:Protein transport protein Sec24-like At3g07100 n=1 Tax=Cuscuta epithymum TaxID=186058 RepID=A0AAV0E5H1_9ASTE|nr:unnamed protein product [Cuscuta epithymum]